MPCNTAAIASSFIATGLLAVAAAAGAQTTYSNTYPGYPPPPPPSQDSRGYPAQDNQYDNGDRDNRYNGDDQGDRGRYDNGDRDNRYNGQDDRGRYSRGEIVECRSSGSRFNRCPVPWANAQLVQQTSRASCVRGRTWGFERGSIWVDQGCAGRFAAVGGGWRPPPGWDHRFVVGCGSPQYRYAFCQVDVGGHGRVYLQQQTSKAACVEGQTWGWNRAGIWTDRGCGGNFMVDRRW